MNQTSGESRYYCGVEGGGTSTTLAISQGNVLLGTKTIGPSRPTFPFNQQEAKQIANMIHEAIISFIPSPTNTTNAAPLLHAIVLSMSGFGQRKEALVLEQAITEMNLAEICIVAGDAAGPLECLNAYTSTISQNTNESSSTTPPTHGIILISGTGSACFRYDLQDPFDESKQQQQQQQQQQHDTTTTITHLAETFRTAFSKYQARSGGRGQLLGDHGSAYWIGQQALSTAFLAYDGMLKRPSEINLIHIATEFYQVETLPDVIPLLYDAKLGKAKIASFAKRIAEEARTNETSYATYEIISEAAEWLARMTSSVIPKENNGKDVHVVVLMVGSVWKSFDMLQESYMERLMLPTPDSTIDLIRLESTAAYGCLNACVRMFGNLKKEAEGGGNVLRELAANSAKKLMSRRGLEL